MSIDQIKFYGLISNKRWHEITGPEFANALRRCGWQEGTGTHFFKRIRQRGQEMGISTPAHLEREIAHGYSAPGEVGKTCHWICNGSVCVVYNDVTCTLITITYAREGGTGED